MQENPASTQPQTQNSAEQSVSASASTVAPAAIILAAGKSTRMKSRLPKPLHPMAGISMIEHVIRACRGAGVQRIVVVVGHEADTVKQGIGPGVDYAVQTQQRGTGDAVAAAAALLGDWQGGILVLCGDVPLLRAETLNRVIESQRRSGSALTMLTALLDDPTGYGRVLRDTDGAVYDMVEQKDADEAQRAIREVNPSIYVFNGPDLWPALAQLTPNNAQNEYYLTDVVGHLVRGKKLVEALPAEDTRDVLGVNTRVELAAAAAIWRERRLKELMLSGVTITAPAQTFIDVDVEIGMDSVIEPDTYLLPGTRIGEDCVIGPMARLDRAIIGNGCRVLASQIVQSELCDGVKVGPFANLRPGSYVGAHSKIGDFVELKNTRLGERVSAGHLTYLGDTEVGAGTNIGAGTITCNYDGFKKHKTVIGTGCFIGSHATLVAPVRIGDGAFIAAASAVPSDVPGDSLTIARCRPVTKEGWAAAWRAAHCADIAEAKATQEHK